MNSFSVTCQGHFHALEQFSLLSTLSIKTHGSVSCGPRGGITLFTLFHNPTELRQKKVNQKGEKKSAVLKGYRTLDASVMVQCATDYATAASSFDSLLLYLINVTNEISCI